MANGPYVGRFAPSATGHLHLGSLVTALATALEAIRHQGRWILRIDDLDQQRCSTRFTESIISTINRYFEPALPYKIYRQSENFELYWQPLTHLAELGLVYQCGCSRRTRAAVTTDEHLCRQFQFSPAEVTKLAENTVHARHFALRFLSQSQADTEDIILLRKEGFFSYHFSCVVNDWIDGTTHLVRGLDLLPEQQPQTDLIKALGYTPIHYAYVHLVRNEQGQKLSKQNHAPPLPEEAKTGLWLALQHFPWSTTALKEDLSNASVDQLWQWAKTYWSQETQPFVCVT